MRYRAHFLLRVHRHQHAAFLQSPAELVRRFRILSCPFEQHKATYSIGQLPATFIPALTRHPVPELSAIE
jgi:hypothetical protein